MIQSDQRQRLLALIIVAISAVICIAVYWDGLYGPLLLDDISNIGNILEPDFGVKDILPNLFSDSGVLKRPVSMFSFILNGLSGAELFHWKLTNLAIHLLSGLLLFALGTRLTRAAGISNSFIPAIAASAWILHPLQVSTVLYTVQRMTELAALFSIAAMLAYTIARERQKAGRRSWPIQALAWLLFFPLGLFSKENVLLFPAFIFLMEVFIFSRERIDNRQLLKIIMILAGLFSIAIVIKGDWLFNTYAAREFTLTERLLTESRVIIAYIGMLLIPAQNRMGFAHDDVILSHGLLDPWTTLPSIFIILALIATAFLVRRNYPLIGFGILFFFVGHSMESTIVPLELMYEHRNYLPSFGILLAATSAISIIASNRRLTTVFTLILFSLLTFITYNRTQTWASTETLYFYMEMVHPKSERLATIKAAQYANASNYEQARSRLDGFSSLGATLQRLSIDCAEKQKLDESQLSIELGSTSQANNYAIMQMIDLANQGIDNECDFSSKAFLSLLDEVIALPTISGNNRQIILVYKAHYLKKTDHQKKAIDTLHEAFSINGRNPTPLFLACEWLLDENRQKEATAFCNKAFAIANSAPFGKYDELAHEVITRIDARKGGNSPPLPSDTKIESLKAPDETGYPQ